MQKLSMTPKSIFALIGFYAMIVDEHFMLMLIIS